MPPNCLITAIQVVSVMMHRVLKAMLLIAWCCFFLDWSSSSFLRRVLEHSLHMQRKLAQHALKHSIHKSGVDIGK